MSKRLTSLLQYFFLSMAPIVSMTPLLSMDNRDPIQNNRPDQMRIFEGNIIQDILNFFINNNELVHPESSKNLLTKFFTQKNEEGLPRAFTHTDEFITEAQIVTDTEMESLDLYLKDYSREQIKNFIANSFDFFKKETIIRGNEFAILKKIIKTSNITLEEVDFWPCVSLILQTNPNHETIKNFFFEMVPLCQNPLLYLTDPLITGSHYSIKFYKKAFRESFPSQRPRDFFIDATFHKKIHKALESVKEGTFLGPDGRDLKNLLFKACFLNIEKSQDLNTLIEIFKSLESPNTKLPFIRSLYIDFLKKSDTLLEKFLKYINYTKKNIFLTNKKGVVVNIFDIFSEIIAIRAPDVYEKILFSILKNPKISPKDQEIFDLSHHFFYNLIEKIDRSSGISLVFSKIFIESFSEQSQKTLSKKNIYSAELVDLFNYAEKKIDSILEVNTDSKRLSCWVKTFNHLKNHLGSLIPFERYTSIVKKFQNNTTHFPLLHLFFLEDDNDAPYLNPFNPQLSPYVIQENASNIEEDSLFNHRVSAFFDTLEIVDNFNDIKNEIVETSFKTLAKSMNKTQADFFLSKFNADLTYYFLNEIQQLIDDLGVRGIVPDLPPHIENIYQELEEGFNPNYNILVQHTFKNEIHPFYKSNYKKYKHFIKTIEDPIKHLEGVIQNLYFNPQKSVSLKEKEKGLLMYYQIIRRLKGETFAGVTFEENSIILPTISNTQFPLTIRLNGNKKSPYISSLKKQIALSCAIIENPKNTPLEGQDKSDVYKAYLDGFLIDAARSYTELNVPMSDFDILKRLISVDYQKFNKNGDYVQMCDAGFKTLSIESLTGYMKRCSQSHPTPFIEIEEHKEPKSLLNIVFMEDYSHILKEIFTSFQKEDIFQKATCSFKKIKNLYKKKVILGLKEKGFKLKDQADLLIDILEELYKDQQEKHQKEARELTISSQKKRTFSRSRSRSSSKEFLDMSVKKEPSAPVKNNN